MLIFASALESARLIQHSTLNTQHSNSSSVEHRSKGTFAIEELFGFILDTQLPDHFKIIIAALHAKPSVLHAYKGNAGNQ